MVRSLKQFLDRYQLPYTETEDLLTIQLRFSLRIHIEFLSGNQVRLTTRLANWNFLTGMLDMRLTSAMIYSTVGVVALTLLSFFLLSTTQDFPWVYVFLGVITWIILWTIYYTVTAVTMHHQIRTWLDRGVSAE